MLTYCTNIHPGEGWDDLLANVEGHGLSVKHRFSPEDPFALGLRISGRAAGEVGPGEVRRFGDWLEENGCYVRGINGFPYGPFHGTAVKRQVYLPDWRSAERVAYTDRLAQLLAAWLPEGVRGSISTVPVAFKEGFDDGHWPLVERHLRQALEGLLRLEEERGAEIALALEPEPGCVLETTAEVENFFARLDLPEALGRHLGLCYDCCHQAVEFEDGGDSLARLRAAGIPIARVQVSSSPRAVGEEIQELARFAEPTYLHQVVARHRDGGLSRFPDLPDFLAELETLRGDLTECRVHFHVPVFAADLGFCGTTRPFLEDFLPRLDSSVPLEVETYSWAVLPEALRAGSVVDSIVRELAWVRDRRNGEVP